MVEDQKANNPYKLPEPIGWQRLCMSLGLLFFLFLCIIMAPVLALFSFNTSPSVRNLTQTEDVDTTFYAHDNVSNDLNPALLELRALLENIPQVNNANSLMILNYQEDWAIREALLAPIVQWQEVPGTSRLRYRASNQIQVSFGDSARFQSSHQTRVAMARRSERTVLTARIVLGLWNSRRFDPRFSQNGSVGIRADEVLAWRGVQKHQRTAYVGANKRFSDGYQEKHKQQVAQDLELLRQYSLHGYHTLVIQGKVTRLPVDSPYLNIMPILGTFARDSGYFVSPGDWIADYETYQHVFHTEMSRKIFQLNPQNDQLAVRIALYLTEHWRRYTRSSSYDKEPLLMANLLSASMISVDKANLTSRFVPRIEAALEKLYQQGILGTAPICLSCVDRTKAQWGKDWLASYWSIVPPQ